MVCEHTHSVGNASGSIPNQLYQLEYLPVNIKTHRLQPFKIEMDKITYN